MYQGWIKLHRKIFDNPLFKRSAYLHLWLALLLKANHQDKKMIWNKEIIVIKEGQLITGRKELYSETGIPESTIEDILKFLESQHQIQQQKTPKFRLITIVNWKEHQISDTKSNNKATTKQQQTDTNKNDKKVDNDKKDSLTETSSVNINHLFGLFIKLNPAVKRMYSHPVQRKACEELLNSYGIERLTTIIEKTLPRTNGMEFFPTITTPLQLQDKYIQLESAVRKYQSEAKSKKDKYQII